MRNIWKLLIVIVGTIGILALTFEEAFVTNPEYPLRSLHIFKYFTVQSNLLAVCYFWIIFSLKMDEKNDKWRNYIGGVMIYTTITFLIFMIFLEGLYIEKGLGIVGSISLHYLNPILIIGYVIYNRKEFSFGMKDSFTWIIYPLLYIIFVVIFGTITSDYLYPFFQISEVGVLGFLLTSVGLIGLFFLLSFFTVKIVSKK